LTVEGNVLLAGAMVNLEKLRLAGAINQTINANGATLERLEVFKTTGIVELTSPLSLTGMLQIGTAGIRFRSQGFLTLLSSSDDASHTAAIGTIPTGSSIEGDVTVQRFMSGEGRLYRYLSSPVSNATVATLMDDFAVTGKFADPSVGAGIVSTSPSLFEYDESAGDLQQGWRGYPPAGHAAEAPLQVGRGYAAFVRNRTPTLLDFAGTINQGEIHLPLGYTLHNGTGNGWHLVGNPYPAAIDWDASAVSKVSVSYVIAIRDNGDHRFRYWDGDSQYTDIPEGRIAPGQSFWVRATAPGASLTFREEAKAVDASFYRRPVAPIPSIRISVSHGRISDHAVLKLRPHCSDSVDRWDGLKLFNDTLNLSILAIGGSRLAIDSRPRLPDSITLRLTDLPPARYILRLSAQDSLRHLTYYVRDSYLKRTEKLDVHDSLEFQVTTDTASSRPARFTLYIGLPEPSKYAPLDLPSLYAPSADSVSVWIGLQASSGALRVYPNPATTELIVEGVCEEGGPAADRLRVALYNAIGMRVSPETFTVRLTTPPETSVQMPERCVLFFLEAEKLSRGTYFVRVDRRSRSSWVRFIKA
ncbi:MAG TPA: T9SS type A sorting domain-containing protein, partial [Chryseolinea sp.]|nr:T9SS type A sorting domain-containing protein [Chryseolinea sp.]